MDVVDDTQLVMLARRPPTEMFPTLRRTSAFAPLLMLACVLPPLYALRFHACDESDALWGLRALELHSVPWRDQALHPPADGAGGALRWQPPLGTWVTAGLVRLTGSAHPFWMVSVSFLSTAASVALFALVLRSVASERVAFWGAILGSVQGSLLALAGRYAPAALGVAFGLLTLWGFLAHLERGTRRASLPLFLGGVGLGGCLLAGGPLAFGVVLMLLLHVLGLRGESLSRRQWSGPRTIHVWSGWPALKSLAALALVGALVGGWWPVLRWWQDGADFLASWMFGTPAPRSEAGPQLPPIAAPSDSADALSAFPARWIPLCGPMFGLILLGLARAVHGMLLSTDEPRRRSQQFLVIWVVCAGVAWWLAGTDRNASPLAVEQWEAFLALGLAGVGAACCDEIASRRLPVRFVATVAALGAGTLLYAGIAKHVPALARQGGGLLAVLAVAGAIATVWKLADPAADKDARRRFVLAAILFAHLTGAVITGLRSVHRTTPDDLALDAFRRGLPAGVAVTDLALIGQPAQVPLRIRLVLRSLWPRANEQFADSWDALLARARGEADPRRVSLAVDWQGRDAGQVNLQAAGLRVSPVSSLQFFEGGPLRAYLVGREPLSLPARGTLAGGHGRSPLSPAP